MTLSHLRWFSHRSALNAAITWCVPRSEEELNVAKTAVAIVEDDESVRKATTHLLRLLGYATASFASAEDFLQSGRVCEIACLITDVHLPGMSGVDLQSRLISDGCRMPTIFITGFPDEGIRARVLTRGAVGYLPKPLCEESLITCLDQAFKHL